MPSKKRKKTRRQSKNPKLDEERIELGDKMRNYLAVIPGPEK
jgi:hypothetical protein